MKKPKKVQAGTRQDRLSHLRPVHVHEFIVIDNKFFPISFTKDDGVQQISKEKHNKINIIKKGGEYYGN